MQGVVLNSPRNVIWKIRKMTSVFPQVMQVGLNYISTLVEQTRSYLSLKATHCFLWTEAPSSVEGESPVWHGPCLTLRAVNINDLLVFFSVKSDKLDIIIKLGRSTFELENNCVNNPKYINWITLNVIGQQSCPFL